MGRSNQLNVVLVRLIIKMKKNQICSILFLISLFMSCQTRDTPEGGSNEKKVKERERFDVFYKEFHKDSLFQISRIKFPLPGINTDDMEVEDTTYFWKKEEWSMHHMVDTTLFFKKTSISDSIVEEEITSEDPGVYIKRKFQYTQGKWYLVLYEDVNL